MADLFRDGGISPRAYPRWAFPAVEKRVTWQGVRSGHLTQKGVFNLRP